MYSIIHKAVTTKPQSPFPFHAALEASQVQKNNLVSLQAHMLSEHKNTTWL